MSVIPNGMPRPRAGLTTAELDRCLERAAEQLARPALEPGERERLTERLRQLLEEKDRRAVRAAERAGTNWTMRMLGLRQRHPGMSYLLPRESPSGEHEAVWTGSDETVVRMHHRELRWLVLSVEAALEPGA